MRQNDLRPPIGSKHRRKRVGRGDGSGHGTYSGRGLKGQKARSGGGVRLGFEGGQLPLTQRLPQKRGFSNTFRAKYNIINIGRLNIFPPGSEVGSKEFIQAGLVSSPNLPIKILGEGDIRHPLVVKAEKFSSSAEKKILAAGGKVERI